MVFVLFSWHKNTLVLDYISKLRYILFPRTERDSNPQYPVGRGAHQPPRSAHAYSVCLNSRPIKRLRLFHLLASQASPVFWYGREFRSGNEKTRTSEPDGDVLQTPAIATMRHSHVLIFCRLPNR